MLSIYNRVKTDSNATLGILDLGLITISLFLSYSLIHNINSSAFNGLEPLLALFLATTVQFTTFWLCVVLFKKESLPTVVSQFFYITKCVLFAVIATSLLIMFTAKLSFVVGLQFLVLDFFLLLTIVIGSRLSYKWLYFWMGMAEYNSTKKVLIYGTKEYGTMILHQLQSGPKTKIKIIGFIDPSAMLREETALYGYPVFHQSGNKAAVQISKADCICISSDHANIQSVTKLKTKAQKYGTKLKYIHLELKNILGGTADSSHTISSKIKQLQTIV